MDGASRGVPLRGGFRIVVVGAANLDIQGKSAQAFRMGDSNPGTLTRAPGGVGRNIAENLVRLGNSVSLIAALGSDRDSGFLETSCRSLGIGCEGLIRADSPCPTYLCVSDADGRLVGAVADMAAAAALAPAELQRRAGLLEGADAIVVDANIPAESIEWLADRFGRFSGSAGADRPLLVLDPVSAAKARRARSCLRGFDIVKPNLAECAVLSAGEGDSRPDPGASAVSQATSMTSESPASAESVVSAVSGLREKGRMPGSLFVSLGENGMAYAEDAAEFRGVMTLPLPPPASRPATRNRSGAGDAACAALVAAALSGLGARGMAACAIAAALLAAASDSPVHSGMSAGAVATLARAAPAAQEGSP